MHTRRTILSIAVLVLLLAPRTVNAQQSVADIRQMLVDRDAEIKKLLGNDETISDDRKEKLRGVINDVIDFRAMGKAALGRHWKKLTTDQQDEFVDVFGKIVRSQSLSDLDVYRSSVTYDDIAIVDSTAHVVTTTTFKDIPTKVEYDLAWNGSEWLATDIILDEVSTVKGYSRSFQSVIRKKGFEELMTRLRKKLSELETPS